MKKQDGEQLAFYPEASPVNRFPSPGSEAAQQMTVTSGRKCCELLPSYDPLSLSAKMLLVSSRWQSRLVNLEWKAETLPLTRIVTQERSIPKKNDMSSQEYCKTLNISVTKSSYLYFRLVPSKPRTDATGYVLLPTPTASDGAQGGIIGADDTYRTTESGTLRKVNRNGIDGSIGLGRLVQLWSTPTACEWKGRGPNSKQQGLAEEVKLWVGTPTAAMRERSGKFKVGRTPNPAEFVQMWPTPTVADTFTGNLKSTQQKPGSMHSVNLTDAVQMFPTPKARDFRSATGKEDRNSPDLNVVVKMLPTPRAFCYKDSTHDRGKGNLGEIIGGQLNPDWVEWLMGFPAGWTDITKDVPLPEYDPHWYDAEPDISRTATGIANRVNRLKCEGNAVDPYQFYPVMEAIATILRTEERGDETKWID